MTEILSWELQTSEQPRYIECACTVRQNQNVTNILERSGAQPACGYTMRGSQQLKNTKKGGLYSSIVYYCCTISCYYCTAVFARKYRV